MIQNKAEKDASFGSNRQTNHERRILRYSTGSQCVLRSRNHCGLFNRHTSQHKAIYFLAMRNRYTVVQIRNQIWMLLSFTQFISYQIGVINDDDNTQSFISPDTGST